jgi:hypothetical protein
MSQCGISNQILIQTEIFILIYFSFFESKPKTTLSDESGESKIEADGLLLNTDDRPATDSSLESGNR